MATPVTEILRVDKDLGPKLQPADTRSRRLTDAEKLTIREVLRDEIAKDPRAPCGRSLRRLSSQHEIQVSYPTITAYWRQVVEEDGNQEPKTPPSTAEAPVDTTVFPLIRSSESPLAAQFDVSAGRVSEVIGLPRVPEWVGKVEASPSLMPALPAVVQLPAVTVVDLVLSARDRATEYNRGFADCYLALAGRGFSVPGLEHGEDALGFRTLKVSGP